MGRRTASIEETRRRIVEATVALHDEKGIAATTYDDIARRADVAAGTVYRHFPTLDAIVAACGARVLEILQPPTPAIFAGLDSTEERLRRLAQELFAFYRRGARPIAIARCDQGKVAALAKWGQAFDAQVAALAREALGALARDEAAVQLTCALMDFYVWKSFSLRGRESEAADSVAEMLLSHLSRTSR